MLKSCALENAYKIFVVKPEGKEALGDLGLYWKVKKGKVVPVLN
jgi:hypothetical protein